MNRTPSSRFLLTRAVGVVAPIAILAACGSSSSGATTTTIGLKPRIIVTSVQGNVESQLVAAIYARALEDGGFRVSRKDPVTLDRAGYIAAMEQGDITLIPEYTGDLLKYVYAQPGAGAEPTTVAPGGPATTEAPQTIPATTTTTTVAGATTTAAATSTTTAGTTTTTVDKTINNGRTPTEQALAIKSALPAALTIGNPAQAEDTDVIACTDAAVKANATVKFATYTNLASVAPKIVLGAPAAWQSDKDQGLAQWTSTYGGTFQKVVTVEAADLATAIDKGTAGCLVLNSLNPLITTKKLTLMSDDKVMTRGNAVVALIAKSVATADLTTALDTVNAALTTARLNQMLNEIATNHTDPTVVANAFMDTL